MSPTRRDFLVTSGALTAGVALVPPTLPALVMPGQASDVPVTTTVAVPGTRGLPPSVRPQDVACRECGKSFGNVLMDEFDRADAVICEKCHEDAVEEAREEHEDDEDDEDWDKDELERQVDEFEAMQKDARVGLEHTYQRFLNLQDDMRVGRLDKTRLDSQLERLRELIEDTRRVLAKEV